jgi:YebC/PmpR family DNA-binding regulatory protein
MAREIIVAARHGADPAANFRLRQSVDRAKTEGLPNENIQRAIEKGSGAGAADNLEELVYEGYGPCGVAIMVRCTTDNRNRTAGDLRFCFSKHGGNLGESGCVGWMFKERGEINLDKQLFKGGSTINEDELILAALDNGANDVEVTEDSALITCDSKQLNALRNALEAAGYKVISAESTMAADSTIEVTDPQAAHKLLSLLDALEELEDVQQVYSNFDMDNALLEGSLA